MSNILWLGHLDTFAVVARLHALSPHTWKGVPERGEVQNPFIGLGASLLLRCHDVDDKNWLHDLPVRDLEPLAGGGAKPYQHPWKSMQKLLTEARKIIMDHPIGRQYLTGDLGRAMIATLKPGSTIFWHEDDGPYHRRHTRFHIPLLTNPGCLMYSGPQMVHMPAGSLFYFNNRIRHSAANWGDLPRLHLIFEMDRVEAAKD